MLGTPAGVREVQLYRSGDANPKFWGPVLKANASAADGAVDCDCAGADWYLFQRAIDGVRDNRLDNGSFEDDAPGGGPPASWANNGGVTSDIVTDWKVTGEQCVELNCLTPGGNISQTFSETTGPIGTYLTAVAWFFIDTLTAPPFGRIGLLLQSEDKPDNYDFWAIDEGTELGDRDPGRDRHPPSRRRHPGHPGQPVLPGRDHQVGRGAGASRWNRCRPPASPAA